MTGFKDVVGRKDLVSYIQKAVTQNQISHAYILNGERGSGKKMFAQLFAMTLQCERGGPEPCNECHSCRQALSGNHPDIIRVVHEKPNTISVEEVRTQINNDIMIRPYNGKIQNLYCSGCGYDDHTGTECSAENDRGAAGVRGDFPSYRKCGQPSSDDFVSVCDAED